MGSLTLRFRLVKGFETFLPNRDARVVLVLRCRNDPGDERIGVLRLGKPLDLELVLLDLDRHLSDLLEYWTERLRKRWRHNCQAPHRITSCR